MTPEELRQRIGEAHEKRRKKSNPREYIGASGIGSPCDAALEFSLRGFPDSDLDGKLLRIFELGHRVEDLVVEDLKMAGMWVSEKNPDTNYQWSYSDLGGHVKAHVDGLCTLGAEHDELMILEIKSMNASNWRKFEKHGVRNSHPKYFDQCQMVMGMAKLNKVFFVAYNKNNSDYHFEIVDADEMHQASLAARVEKVFEGRAEKVSDKEDDWRCASCFKNAVCWEGKLPAVKCPTCKFAQPNPKGGWHCTKWNEPATKPCPSYEVFRPKAKSSSGRSTSQSSKEPRVSVRPIEDLI